MSSHDFIQKSADREAAENWWATDIIDRSAASVARLCRNVQLTLDPARIVIGGGVGLAEGYVARIEAALGAVEPDLRPRLAPAAKSG